MQKKKKLLSELYHGRLCPMEKSIIPGSAVAKNQQAVSKLEETLMAELSEEQQRLLHDFITAQGELLLTSGEERFTDGFRMGAKMILEILEKDDELLDLKEV